MTLVAHHDSGAEIWDVEMECIWGEKSELNLIVTSPGPYKGCKVNCSRAGRVHGTLYSGRVYAIQLISAEVDHCILVNSYGKRDIYALKRLD